MVEETSPGIFTVTGDYLPIQIIESGKLPERENLLLRSLKKGLLAGNTPDIIEKIDKSGDKTSLGVYLDVLLRANPQVFKEAINMARRGLPTLEEALEEIGILPRMIERAEKKVLEKGLETVARNAMAKGLPIDLIHEITGLPAETIAQL